MSGKMKNSLIECLAEKEIRQWQLAHRLHMSRAYVSRLCSGQIQPSLEAAFRIAQLVGKPVDKVFQLVDDESHFPSVPGCGQEHPKTPETINKKKVCN